MLIKITEIQIIWLKKLNRNLDTAEKKRFIILTPEDRNMIDCVVMHILSVGILLFHYNE